MPLTDSGCYEVIRRVHRVCTRAYLMHALHHVPDDGSREEEDDDPIPWEPAGHEAIETGNVASCAAFWRTLSVIQSP